MSFSGLIQAAIDRVATPIESKPDESRFIGASVTAGDEASGKWRRTGDADLIGRVRQQILIYAGRNAQACAAQPLRLFRRVGADDGKCGRMNVRRVKDRKRLAYLRCAVRGYGPGAKAASVAGNYDDLEEVVDSDLQRLMRNANPWQRGVTFAEYNFFQWMIYGRSYVYVAEENGKPSSMWTMNAQNVWIIPSKEDLIGGFRYGRDQSIAQDFTTDEVMYHRLCASPFNPYDAIGPLHAALEDADLYSAIITGELANQRNGARPDWVLGLPEGSTKAQVDAVTAQVNAQLRGPRQRGSFLVTTMSEAKALQFSPREMENLGGKADLRKTMRSAYGYPESLEENNSGNLSSAKTGLEMYMRFTIGPICNKYSQEWAETLFPKFDLNPDEYCLAYDNPVAEDEASIREDIKAFVPLKVLTRNEARARIGEDPIEGGDEFDEPEPTMPEGYKPGEDGKEDPPKKEEKAVVRVKDDDLRAPIPKQIQSIVEQWLLKVAEGYQTPATAADVNLGAFVNPLASSLTPPIAAELRRGAEAGAAQVGFVSADPAALFSTNAVEYARKHTLRLAGGVARTTEIQIQDEISAGLARGATQTEIVASVRSHLVDSAPYRAVLIARNETNRAYNYGNYEAWKKAGVWGVEIELSDDACPVCVALLEEKGSIKPIGEPYIAKGGKIKVDGQDVTFDYESIYVPPIHPACRCTPKPVMKKPVDWKEEK